MVQFSGSTILFILNFVQLMAREKGEWPLIDEALSSVFGVSVELAEALKGLNKPTDPADAA